MFLFIKGEDWGRYREKIEQAVIQINELHRRLYEQEQARIEFRRKLLVTLVAGVFALAAAGIGAILHAVMS